MRGILNGPNFPYKAAFDLNTRKIHYFIEKNYLNAPKYKKVSTQGMYDYIYRKYYKNEEGQEIFYQPAAKLLNKDFTYVYRNMMTIDNDETGITMVSIMPETFTFVGEKEVYDYVKMITMLEQRAEPNKIDEFFNYIAMVKAEYVEYGNSIFDIILGEFIYGS